MSTMSARVLSPAVLSELRRIRAPKGANGRAADIAGVRRNLFGSPGAAAKALADLELNRATDEGCRRWGFDFRAERPLAGKNRFDWKKTDPRQTILRPAVISSTPAIISSTPAIITPLVTPMEVELQPTQKIEEKTKPDPSKIQTRITGRNYLNYLFVQ